MISNIKSKYILAIIFGLLKPKYVLKIVVHNKNLQKKLDINLDLYIQHCGRYIEINGNIGTERLVNENIVIFKGEYKSMRRNGKGKEFYKDGKVQFEGEYKDNKRWNGKIYNKAGIEEFEIIDGSGYIREYNINGIIIYEGDIVHGIKEGFGKEYFGGKIEYEGIFRNGKRDIEGTEYYTNGNIEYKGEYKSGEKNGKGKTYEDDGNLLYDGEYSNGFKNGNGEEYNFGKLIFILC